MELKECRKWVARDKEVIAPCQHLSYYDLVVERADGDILTDADGNTAAARIGDFATVYPILPVRTDKLDFLFDTCVYKKAMATVSLPAEAFAAEGEAFDAARVTEIRLRFTGGGEIALDNLGLEY